MHQHNVLEIKTLCHISKNYKISGNKLNKTKSRQRNFIKGHEMGRQTLLLNQVSVLFRWIKYLNIQIIIKAIEENFRE